MLMVMRSKFDVVPVSGGQEGGPRGWCLGLACALVWGLPYFDLTVACA